MSFERGNTSSNDLPIAESTQIEKNVKTPLRRLKLSLANRLGFSSNPNSPKETPPPKRNAVNSPTLSKLDPKVYLDTQSNGFASRVVKYHEASEAKGREIANKSYRRPGDFPIVNFDKSEINLNQKQANEPKVSKISIAPPINLVSATNASARSVIFRTGKNYGDSYPIGKLGPIEGRKPIKATLPQDEPIVPTSNDYDNAPIRSSLEALKEISRKRIHCDEIDGETNKKQRSDLNEYDQNNAQAANSSKRTRDRTSPSYCGSVAEVQKKRYKNNDILSSLSSSILTNTPKRSLISGDGTPTKVLRPELNYGRKDANENASSENYVVVGNRKAAESSRVGTSNSDLPLHRPSEQIKPVIKSMSDGYVPPTSQATTKTTKLTLFNKVYSDASSAGEKKKAIDDDEDNSISFVKPKVKTSTIFGASKNRDQKSKLAMMLSFLRGDESKDEVDSVRKPLIGVEKSDQSEEIKTSSTSTSANLSTITSVTFSTATTTSLLNAPSDATTKSIVVEPPKSENKVVSTSAASSTTVTGFTPSTSVSTSSTTIVTPSVTSQSDKPQTSAASAAKPTMPIPTVTFNLPTTTSASVAPTSAPVTTTSDTAPRLGGFNFSASSPPSYTSTLTAPKSSTTQAAPTSKVEEKVAPPTFSFGLAKPTTSTGTLPSFTPPTFGSITQVKTETSTTPTVNITTTSAPPAFNFGSSATQSPALPANTGISFGALAKTSTPSAPTVTSTPVASAAAPNAFVFGSGSNATVPVPTFGLANANATTASGTTTVNKASPSFSFGAAANTSKPETGAFQFGNTAANATTPALTFGSPSPTVATTAAPSTGLFGTPNLANQTPATQSAFGAFGANKPNADAKPLFGTPTTQSSGFGAFSTPKFGDNKNATPTFGSISNNTATTTSSTSIFGSTPAAPVFGSNNTLSAQPKSENIFGTPTNQSANTPVFGGQNQTNSFGKPSMNAPTFGSTNSSNIFGSAPTTQSQPAFGTSNSIFSTPTTTSQSSSAFGAPATGVFAFGQNAAQSTVTTASTGIFGTSNTNTNTTPNAPFVFGQSNTAIQQTTPSPSSGIFGAKPAENTALSAPPAFGSTSPAFNFTAKPAFGSQAESKPAPFTFSSNNAPSNVPAFGSAPNGIGSSFAFGSANSQPEAAKPFNFGAPATAPAAAPASFSFNAPNQGAQNAYQFNASPQPPANIFSIGPGSGTNTAKTGRPIRTAVRRMK